MLLCLFKFYFQKFCLFQLLEFVFYTETGATANARFKAIEIASTNLFWLVEKENDLVNSFGTGGLIKKAPVSSKVQSTAESLRIKLNEMYSEFQTGDLSDKKKVYEAKIQTIRNNMLFKMM